MGKAKINYVSRYIGALCSGSTYDFDSYSPGSNPGAPAKKCLREDALLFPFHSSLFLSSRVHPAAGSQAHNLEVVGSSPTPATKEFK